MAGVQRPSSRFNIFKTNNKPLLIRGTLGNVFETPLKHEEIKPNRPKKFLSDVPPPAIPPLDSNLNLPIRLGFMTKSRNAKSRMGSRFGNYSQASFFSRHNPHPARVRHIRGLNGIPICTVHDEGYFPLPRIGIEQPSTREREAFIEKYISSNGLGLNSTSFPINTITGLQHYPYKEKAIPKIGLVPITNTWRSELRELCSKAGLLTDNILQPTKPARSPLLPSPSRSTAYSAETGRIIPPSSRAVSRVSFRSQPHLPSRHNHYEHITLYPDTETLMLEMLCQILQTDSVPLVQQWLVSASDREKDLVLDMVQTSVNKEEKLLQQQYQQAVPQTPFTPLSRSLSSMSSGSRANSIVDGRASSFELTRRSGSVLTSRSSSSRSITQKTPVSSPVQSVPTSTVSDEQRTSLRQFDTLPKIEEVSQSTGVSEESAQEDVSSEKVEDEKES